MTEPVSEWKPDTSVCDHNGQPLSSTDSFFAPPPDEIGTVLSAHSNRKHGRKENSLVRKILFALVYGVSMGLLMLLVGPFTRLYTPEARPVVFVVGAVVGIGVGFLMMTNFDCCTYVGKRGIAECDYSKEPKKEAKFLLFDKAAELRTAITAKYTNGMYQGTKYSYNWTDSASQTVYTLSGSFFAKQGLPDYDSSYHFALAAEQAWTNHLMEVSERDLAERRPVRFNLQGKDYLIIAPGQIELQTKGQVTTCFVDEIDKFEIKKGVVTLRRKDAKSGLLGIGANGTFTFEYQQLANANFCFALLDRLFGVEQFDD